MHITQLEIDNFKSFARKTKIPFFEGFTVISGPNGSGKSNIIDAILFCLALSSSRGLRAEKLTDLINLNSGKNNAEVAITFSDGSTVRRRIKRTPAGYYSYNYLNERLCKQSDIIDLLAKMGIKPEGYNVVMQGDITRIMEMSDVERRRIIDDIAGVAEFDHKKEQSLAELEVVRERIEREELLLRELGDQLRKLLHERDRALEYRKLQEELAFFQRCLGAARLKEKQHELATATQLAAEQQQAMEGIAAQIREKEGEIATLRTGQEGLEAELNQKSGPEYMELLARLEAAKSGIKLAEQTIARARGEKEENTKSLSAVFADTKRAEATVKDLNEAIRSFGIDRANLAMDLATGKANLGKLEADLADRSKEVEGAKEHLFAQMEQVEGLKGKRADLLRQQDAIVEKSRMRISELERLSARLQAVTAEGGEKQKQSGECTDQRAKCLGEKSRLERVIADAEASLFAQRAAQERIRKEVKVRETDLMRLEAQQQAREGGDNRALEAVLAMEGVHGTIAQLGKAPKQYAVALDVAVGGKLNYVVADDDSVASSAIGYLKENKLGRVTFLPLNKLRPVDLPAVKGDGIIGYAVDLVEFDPLFDSAFRTVLGATVVVETLEKARRMMGRHRMVTLEGELLERSGAMTGGSLKRGGRGFGVAAGDEIATLKLALAGLAQEAADCDAAIAALAQKVEETRGKRSSVEEQVARYTILLEEYEKRMMAITPEREELESTIAAMRTDASGSSGELAAIEASVTAVNKEIAAITKEIDDLKGRLEDRAIPQLVENVEKARQDLEEKDRRLRNKDTDIADKQRERQYFAKRVEELGAEQKKIADKNTGIDGDIAAAEGQITAHREVIAECEEKQKAFSQELETLRRKRDGIAAKIRTIEHRVMELGSETERIRVQVTALQEKARTLAAEIEALLPSAGEEQSDLSLEEITAGIKKSEDAITAIGAINMLAVEEYDRVNARVAERSEKKETLSRERTNIIERIDKYEKMKFEAFATAFREIDTNFQAIFARLTSGTGKLVLENEEDPFTGGLTFAVQPRDKKVRLLSALSGGEKSLTTLAFIFSIQKHLPAPFYALDEVDMFLDGYNVERIATLIRELSTNVQSVIVSLRKPMIESADRVIGVTLRPDKSTLVTGVKSNG